MFSQGDIKKLFKILPTRRENALTAKAIAKELGFPTDGNEVKTRKLIKHALQIGILVKSTTATPKGYWVSDNKNETKKYYSSLKKRAKAIISRAESIKKNWNKKHPDEKFR